MASFAVAGFAAFAPSEAGPELPAPPVTVTDVRMDDSTPGDLGLVAGRVAAMNFATSQVETSTRTTVEALNVNDLIVAQAATITTTTVAYAPSLTAAPRATPRDYSNVPSSAAPWRGLVEAFFAPADVDRALWVIHCESTGDPNAAHGSSGAAGLFQHLPKFWEERSTKAGVTGADIFDPDSNVAVAAWLVYSGGGWRHWNPSAHCWG